MAQENAWHIVGAFYSYSPSHPQELAQGVACRKSTVNGSRVAKDITCEEPGGQHQQISQCQIKSKERGKCGQMPPQTGDPKWSQTGEICRNCPNTSLRKKALS